MDDRFQMHTLCRDKRKAIGKVVAHGQAEDGQRAGARAIIAGRAMTSEYSANRPDIAALHPTLHHAVCNGDHARIRQGLKRPCHCGLNTPVATIFRLTSKGGTTCAIFHTMVRVKDLDAFDAFYKLLGLEEITAA